MESMDISMSRQFPELRKKEPGLLGYKYRDEEDDIHVRRQKVSYADLVRDEEENIPRGRVFKEREQNRDLINRNRRQQIPVLVNRNIREDRKERDYYKDFDSREEDINKERYGLALKKDHGEQKEEVITMEKIALFIERAMNKNKEYIENFIRSQEKMWKEMDIRMSRIERKVGIQDSRQSEYWGRKEINPERSYITKNRQWDRTSRDQQDQDKGNYRAEEEWNNDHDYDY